MHYKRMYDDKEFLYEYDLDGKDVTVTIEKCVAGELTGDKGRKSKKPMVSFVGTPKKLALNKTNGKAIASMYGTSVEAWAGKQITLYPTVTDFGGETLPCIRVRPTIPTGKASKATAASLSAQIADKMAEIAADDAEKEE